MKRTLILITILTSLLWANPFERLDDSLEVDSVILYNPALTTSLSIIPGGGLFYTKRYAKGTVFLGMEALMGSQAVMRHRWYRESYKPYNIASDYYDSLFADLGTIEGTIKDSINVMSARNSRDLREYEIEKARIDWLNWSTWFGGIFIWNLGSALDASNQFTGEPFPEPKRAGGLSAIPFTGAGQFYNGEISKGAMFATVQIGCMISAINFSRLMKDAEEYKENLLALPDSIYVQLPSNEKDEWNGKYEAAQRSRTMFMWYGVFFYMFGIADAAVDAHLAGFEDHFEISGAVDPIEGKMSFTLNGEFGKNYVYR